jgi:hypothetical protein
MVLGVESLRGSAAEGDGKFNNDKRSLKTDHTSSSELPVVDAKESANALVYSGPCLAITRPKYVVQV